MSFQTRKQLLLIFSLVKRYTLILAFFPFLMGVDIAFELGISKIQGIFIDTIDSGTRSELIVVIQLVVCILVAAIILLGVHRHLIEKLLIYVHRDLTLRLFSILNKAPIGKIKQHHSGFLMNRLKEDVQHGSTIVEATIEFVTVLILIILSFVYLLQIDPLLACIGLGSVPILFGVGRLFDSRIRKHANDVQQKEGALNETVQEYIKGLSLVKVFGESSMYINRFIKQRKELNKAHTSLSMANAISQNVSESIFNVVYIAALLFIGLASIRDSLTPGTLVTFTVLFELVVWPVIGLSSQYSRVQEGVGAFQRIYEFLEIEFPTVGEKRNLERVEHHKNTFLSIEGLSFRSSDSDRIILDEINFSMQRGEVVAIIGASGAGKSTFAKLCCGLFEPSSGMILINGELPAESLAGGNPVATYMSQSPYLFSGTIKENVSLGNTSASDEAIQTVLQEAEFAGYLEKLTKREDTVIGDGGAGLSGGQKQRLALSRLFFNHKDNLIVMDEPTSALDMSTERKIIKSLKKFLYGRTAIIVTHRLSLLSLANRILVMDQGKIVEEGTHAELILKSEHYKRFLDEESSVQHNEME